VAGPPIPWRSALSPKGSDSASPNVLNPCPSCASVMRLSQAEINRTRSVLDPATSHDSGFYKLRSPNLSAMKSRDPKTHLESGENLVKDWNAIDFT
jgi:hypothetical protein